MNREAQVSVRGNDMSVILSGEILVYGVENGGLFEIESIRRFALSGFVDQRDVQTISIAGPQRMVEMHSGNKGSSIFDSNLHYAALSRGDAAPAPRFGDDDILFPQVEIIQTDLSWQSLDAGELFVRFQVSAQPARDDQQGLPYYVERIVMEPFDVEFLPVILIEDRTDRHRQQLQLNLPDCEVPPPEPSPWNDNLYRLLRVRFYHVHQNIHPVASILQRQLQAVSELWRIKAALGIVILEDGSIDLVSQDILNTYFDEVEASEDDWFDVDFPQSEPVHDPILNERTINYTRIFLVDKFKPSNREGGGLTKSPGQASAYCIISLGMAQNNDRLLAHELCHVLGLDHPMNTPPTTGQYPASSNSIGQAGTPNPNFNTAHNCRIYTTSDLNPLVLTTNLQEPLRPDRQI